MQKIAGELVRGHTDLRPNRGWLESMHVRYIGDLVYIFVRSVIPKNDIDSTKTMLARLQRRLSSHLGMPVQIRMVVIPVDLEVISVGSDFKIYEPGQ